MRRLCDLVLFSLLLAGCSGGGSGESPSPTPTAGNGGGTRTPTHGSAGATRTPTRSGGPTSTATHIPPTRTPTVPGPIGTPTPTPIPMQAQILYVRVSGDDANPGTSADQALKTLGQAAEMLVPGTTVYVGPGRYRGRVDVSGVPGTASAPVKFVADRKGAKTGDRPGQVTIDAGGSTAALVLTRSPYLTIQGFLITGALPQVSPAASATEVNVRSASNHATIRDCLIGGSDSTDAIRVDGSSDVVVFNNLLFDVNRGLAITGDALNTDIINNTIIGTQRAAILLKQKGGLAPTDATVLNNIIQDNRNKLGIDVDTGPPSSLPGYVGNFNLVFEPAASDQTRAYSPVTIHGTRDLNVDAQFENAAQQDVHLQPTSPAIDAGTRSIDGALLSTLFAGSTTRDGNIDKTPIDLGYHYPR